MTYSENMINVTWLILAFSWLIYSYGFVDLNLTISSNPHWLAFLAPLQHLVYFNRPLSLQIFVALIILSYLAYSITLLLSQPNRFPWKWVIIITGIFSLAYPLLSADSFKYLFAAKELLLYHANPHVVPPNAFPDDLWIRFMRWVHTPSPYGPVETLLAIPPYLLGLGRFVPALFLLKIQNWGFYLLTVWCIRKLSDNKAALFFALNPLVLVEWLINAHNDAGMIALLLLAMYYLLSRRKRVLSIVTLLLSVGIKFVTVLYLPFIILKKRIPTYLANYTLLVALAAAPLLYNYTTQYQPWYVTWLVPLAALVDTKWVRWTVAAYSLSVLSRYLSYVGTGFWETNQLTLVLSTFTLPAVVALIGGSMTLAKAWRNRL